MTEKPAPEERSFPAFEVLNGDGKAEILLVCDHASRALPSRYGTLGLDESYLWRHIAWDIGIADVTRRLSKLLDAPAVLSGFSRLLIDPNRFPGDVSSIPEVSDEVEIPANLDLAEAEKARRAELYFHPYQDALGAQVARMTGAGRVPAIFSMHSFTPVMKGHERPWHVGVLWDGIEQRLAEPLLVELRANPTLTVGDNEPYSAKEPYGYSMAEHGIKTGLPHVVLEVRQDLIDTHHGAEEWANMLADAFRRVIGHAGPFKAAPRV